LLKIGYILYLSDRISLEDRIKLVIRHYTRKAGHKPDFIVLNKKFDVADKFDGVAIIKRLWIAKDSFFVGMYG
jgi:hypothetical protein